MYKKPLYNSATDFTPVVADRRGADRPDRAQGPAGERTSRNSSPTPRRTRAKMQFGSAGAGSATHLGCVLLNYIIGTNITHVPYRGTGPAMQDLQGGRIDFLCEIITTAKPQVDGGTVKALAIFTQGALAGAAEPADRRSSRAPRSSRPIPGTRCSCRRARPPMSSRSSTMPPSQAMKTPAVRERLRRARRRDRVGRSRHAGISRPVRQERDREMGGSDQGQRRELRLIAKDHSFGRCNGALSPCGRGHHRHLNMFGWRRSNRATPLSHSLWLNRCSCPLPQGERAQSP